jgi:hypothetical protein
MAVGRHAKSRFDAPRTLNGQKSPGEAGRRCFGTSVPRPGRSLKGTESTKTVFVVAFSGGRVDRSGPEARALGPAKGPRERRNAAEARAVTQ